MFNIGDHVRITAPNPEYHGRTGVIRNIGLKYDNLGTEMTAYRIEWDKEGEEPFVGFLAPCDLELVAEFKLGDHVRVTDQTSPFYNRKGKIIYSYHGKTELGETRKVVELDGYQYASPRIIALPSNIELYSEEEQKPTRWTKIDEDGRAYVEAYSSFENGRQYSPYIDAMAEFEDLGMTAEELKSMINANIRLKNMKMLMNSYYGVPVVSPVSADIWPCQGIVDHLNKLFKKGENTND